MLCVGYNPVVCDTIGVGARTEFAQAVSGTYDIVGIGFACTEPSSGRKLDSISTPGISAGM